MHSWGKEVPGAGIHLVNTVHVCCALAARKILLTFMGLHKIKWNIFNTESQLRFKQKPVASLCFFSITKADHLWLKQELTEISAGWL